VLTSRSLDGAYPKYRQLIPESFNRRIQLDRRALMASLERVAVLADQHNNVVKLSVDPAAAQVQISADAQDVGSGSEALGARISGEEIQIAFNVRYLLDGLKAMAGDQIVLSCNGPTTPAVLSLAEDPQFTYLVMSKDGVQQFTVQRDPGWWRWLKEQALRLAQLVEADQAQVSGTALHVAGDVGVLHEHE
jgi:DNA polymerase-3 subunit beta